ncbi:unnamed protein product, partial [Effrenium voratum]
RQRAAALGAERHADGLRAAGKALAAGGAGGLEARLHLVRGGLPLGRHAVLCGVPSAGVPGMLDQLLTAGPSGSKGAPGPLQKLQ